MDTSTCRLSMLDRATRAQALKANLGNAYDGLVFPNQPTKCFDRLALRTGTQGQARAVRPD
eukprot:14622254-Alexandrium_andersonii.AAC.1